MSENSDGKGPTSRRPASVRNSQYMIAPAGLDVTRQTLVDRLNQLGNIEIRRTYAERENICPPISVVRASDETMVALRRSLAGAFVIEPDRALRAASVTGASPQTPLMAAMTELGPAFTVTIQALSENGKPVEHAAILLVGERGTIQGLTDGNGKADLTLYGELPETMSGLLIRPRSSHWGLWRQRPELRSDTVNSFTLQALSLPERPDWGAQAMRFDQLPTGCRGAGIKIALIDSGVAVTHEQLKGINRGVDIGGSGEQRSWSQDDIGHGTPCASVISAVADTARGIRGYAPEAELHVCKLPADARCSDLVAALDYCLQNGIDVACLGYGCERGSAIVGQRIAAAKQQGVGVIAAAGNSAAAVLFPASSPQVVAVGAIGQLGSSPNDSPQAAEAAATISVARGLFVPAFSCRGPELDVCAPGVAVIACQSPDTYAVCDGTSLATAHVTALAALILAHHSDFKGGFARRDFQRVERLFQILKGTAQPIGHPWLTGAGLPDAARALGVRSAAKPIGATLNAELAEMRSAIRQLNQIRSNASEANLFEPPRGPANVSQLPLNPTPWSLAPERSADESVRELKEAMMLAGLSDAR
ncbi:subtilisin [Bradyrhizobium sp. i1.8.4]|uniref:S8 family peptidase n=1 Tax=unclassified Bradyrhizobium TaxID=2631580 RepID=UPI003D1E20AD